MKKLIIILVVLFTGLISINAQVGINSTGAAPATSAMLDVSSTSKGLLIPRMTTVQRTTGIASPATGLLVYDTDLKDVFIFDVTWKKGTVSNPPLVLTSINTPIKGVSTNPTSNDVGVWGETSAVNLAGGTGVYGLSSNTSPSGHNFGVYGETFSTTDKGYGVYGKHTGTNGVAIQGESTNGALAIGVQGISPSGFAVQGLTTNGIGVRGFVTGVGIGVYGRADPAGSVAVDGSSVAGIGIRGSSNSSYGVTGQSTSGNGVRGISTSGFAVQGLSTSNAALYGFSGSGNGLYAETNGGTAAAARIVNNSGTGNAIDANNNSTTNATGKFVNAIGPVLSMVGPGATSSTSSTTNPIVRMGITNDSNYGWVRFENSTGARHFSQRYDLVSTTASINSYALYYGTDQLFTVRGSGSFGLNVSNPLDLLHLSPISATGDVFARISSTTGFTGLRLDNNTGDYQLFSNEFGGLFLDYSLDNYATRTGILTFAPNASNFEMRPAITNNVFLGTSAFRWKEIWSQNALNTSSDRRLKKNINEIKYGLDEVMKLQAVTYNWKDTDDKKLQLGFIAQDVEKIVPEIVTKSGISDEEFERLEKKGEKVTDTYGMQYTGLIPVLVKAIQEQQKVIADKLSRIEQLEEKIQKLSSLEARLSMLENTLNAQKVSNSISNDK